MRNRMLPALFICVCASACAPIKAYRTVLPPDSGLCVAQNSPAECPQDAFYLARPPLSAGPEDDIPIGIIEFDDQGALQSRRFKEEIMTKIRDLTAEHGTLTVVFAHGWLNNAAPDNGNLENFQKMLIRIAQDDRKICEKHGCAGRRVVGVYLAWRGLSATVQPFRALSFWNRKSRAHRVGQDGATEILTELGKIKAGGGDMKSKNRLILVGHSFGGALIYSATQQLLMKDAAYQPGAERSVLRTAANLVILVNPAFEAARFTSLHEKSLGLRFPPTQSPILAVFTSETDRATRTAFPLGRWLSSLFTKYNPSRPDQARLNRTALGHYGDYQTHRLSLGAGELASPVESICAWKAFEKGAQNWDLGRVVLERKGSPGPRQHMNPYYNVAVDDAIISGHSGIWEPEYFMEFIYRFVAVQDRRSCEFYRTLQ